MTPQLLRTATAAAVQAALLCLAHRAGVTAGEDGEELWLTAIEALRNGRGR